MQSHKKDYADSETLQPQEKYCKTKKTEMAPATKPESADEVLKHRITLLERRLAELQV